MKMSLDNTTAAHSVRSYQPGCVTISGEDYRSSVIVSAGRIIADWPPTQVAHLTGRDLRPLIDDPPELIIIGTGEQQVFPDPGIFTTLMDLGIGFEVMNNGAACRTYNILLAEQRRVALALLIEPAND
jgi:uncharacterized protein